MCDFVCETMSHAISRCFIGQLYTIRCLLSDILGVYQKRLHVLWVHSRSRTFYTSFSDMPAILEFLLFLKVISFTSDPSPEQSPDGQAGVGIPFPSYHAICDPNP